VPPRAGVQAIFASGIEEFHEVSSPSFSVTAVNKGVRPLRRQGAMAARRIPRRSGHAYRDCRVFRRPLLVHSCADSPPTAAYKVACPRLDNQVTKRPNWSIAVLPFGQGPVRTLIADIRRE
jgi:hypothetical protein